MNKKIVVLTGSARKGGNSNKMAEAFMEAAKAKGHIVIHHDTTAMTFTGCRGCESCYSTGKPCIFEDDFNKIAPDLLVTGVLNKGDIDKTDGCARAVALADKF